MVLPTNPISNLEKILWGISVFKNHNPKRNCKAFEMWKILERGYNSPRSIPTRDAPTPYPLLQNRTGRYPTQHLNTPGGGGRNHHGAPHTRGNVYLHIHFVSRLHPLAFRLCFPAAESASFQWFFMQIMRCFCGVYATSIRSISLNTYLAQFSPSRCPSVAHGYLAKSSVPPTNSTLTALVWSMSSG